MTPFRYSSLIFTIKHVFFWLRGKVVVGGGRGQGELKSFGEPSCNSGVFQRFTEIRLYQSAAKGSGKQTRNHFRPHPKERDKQLAELTFAEQKADSLKCK